MKETLDFQRVHSVVWPLLDETDTIITKGFTEQKQVSFKGNSGSKDIVTDVDIAVEKKLRQVLGESFPEIGFVGEELGSEVGEEYTWVIDPIDGTLNFAKGVPIFGTSIALWKNGSPCYGIHSFPTMSLRVHSWDGGGIWVNGIKREGVEKALGDKSFTVFSMREKAEVIAEIIKKSDPFTEVFRDFGSAVYHLSSTAIGRTDVAIIANLAPWDIGVAELFMKEAGLFCEFLGEKPDLADHKGYSYTVVVGRNPWAEKTASIYKGEVA